MFVRLIGPTEVPHLYANLPLWSRRFYQGLQESKREREKEKEGQIDACTVYLHALTGSHEVTVSDDLSEHVEEQARASLKDNDLI